MIAQIKHIIKESEIMKYVNPMGKSQYRRLMLRREDDSKWPEKNKDGRQELEIRLGNEHISFEVNFLCYISIQYKFLSHLLGRLLRSDHWST